MMEMKLCHLHNHAMEREENVPELKCSAEYDYNIHQAMWIAELEKWFFATFEFWPTNPIELITVFMGGVESM
uniref:Uncharacterized protein n=1 Tax=Romanomermis culicivorax TaxID=13658 RepID=A0A915J0Z4_ROMCU